MAIIALLSIAALALLIVRVGTKALMLTGLSEESASFQASSAFFGVGFTTSEAESVVNHPVRRRIIKHLIITGNIGLTSALTTAVVAFLSEGAGMGLDAPSKLTIIAGGILILVLISRMRIIRRGVDAVIAWTLHRAGMRRVMDYELMLRMRAGFAVSEVAIENKSRLAGRTLHQADLRRRGVLVLGITRDNGRYIGTPTEETMLQEGDTVLVYSREEEVENLAAGQGGPGLESAP